MCEKLKIILFLKIVVSIKLFEDLQISLKSLIVVRFTMENVGSTCMHVEQYFIMMTISCMFSFDLLIKIVTVISKRVLNLSFDKDL